jgi:hypothetical protein
MAKTLAEPSNNRDEYFLAIMPLLVKMIGKAHPIAGAPQLPGLPSYAAD